MVVGFKSSIRVDAAMAAVALRVGAVFLGESAHGERLGRFILGQRGTSLGGRGNFCEQHFAKPVARRWDVATRRIVSRASGWPRMRRANCFTPSTARSHVIIRGSRGDETLICSAFRILHSEFDLSLLNVGS